MHKKFQKLIAKIFVGILMPIFLFGFWIVPASAETNVPISINFELKQTADAPQLFQDYDISPKLLFGQTFTAAATLDVLSQMQLDPRVVFAERDETVTSADVTTNDPFFTTDPTDQDKQWYLPKINISKAWTSSVGKTSTVVAILDTGIHASNVELNDGRVIAGYNSITDQPIPANSDSDDNGHGTAVAGVIGAIPNNAKGISGVDWNVQLMPIKAIDAAGNGHISAVAEGIVWATDHGANIINMSLGGTGFGSDETLSAAISYAYNKGVLLVAAAGNDSVANGLNLDSDPVYPVCADNGLNMVLGVAATDVNDQRASFSNYGAGCIDVSAPGVRILTTAWLPSDPTNNYVLIYASGTSLATPIVSGIAALIKSSNPDLSNVEIRNAIINTTDNIDAQNTTDCNGGSCMGLLGSGRVDAYNYFGPKPVANGTLLEDSVTQQVYFIQDNTKRPVSSFVLKQHGFDLKSILVDTGQQLSLYPTAAALPPYDGTLIKSADSPAVYIVEKGQIEPVSYFVFVSRNFHFNSVVSLPDQEVASYIAGTPYPPADGAVFVVSGYPQVYVMENGAWRPISYFTFINRGLLFANVVTISAAEFGSYPIPPDAYWLPPLDGTIIKTADNPAVYVIENGMRHVLSADAFTNRRYSYGQIQILSDSELGLIAPGDPILK